MLVAIHYQNYIYCTCGAKLKLDSKLLRYVEFLYVYVRVRNKSAKMQTFENLSEQDV